ncbi:MAG: hypothetical protein KAY32_09470 [Candidatus Eisenbacteria sp.]|nr:hypothetical protein [Candidatus Eisenbacteria bacterium]
MQDLPLGYILIFLLVAGFLYYRFLRGKRRKGAHGRELWRQKTNERRSTRLDRARTWDERRRRMKMYEPQWKIAERYVRKESREGSTGQEQEQARESAEVEERENARDSAGSARSRGTGAIPPETNRCSGS